MSSLPTGTVTFLFTDIEGSTRLWEEHPDAAREALARHDRLVEEIVERNGGSVVRPRGEGDSRFAVFSRATGAVSAAAELQIALQNEPWRTPVPLKVRMALHTGEADLREGDYYGSAVNRCARLRSAAHGGQILLSQITYEIVRDSLEPAVTVQDLGEHRLKDLAKPEHIFQLTPPGLPADFPPLTTLDVRPNNLPLLRSGLVGREKLLERDRSPRVLDEFCEKIYEGVPYAADLARAGHVVLVADAFYFGDRRLLESSVHTDGMGGSRGVSHQAAICTVTVPNTATSTAARSRC